MFYIIKADKGAMWRIGFSGYDIWGPDTDKRVAALSNPRKAATSYPAAFVISDRVYGSCQLTFLSKEDAMQFVEDMANRSDDCRWQGKSCWLKGDAKIKYFTTRKASEFVLVPVEDSSVPVFVDRHYFETREKYGLNLPVGFTAP